MFIIKNKKAEVRTYFLELEKIINNYNFIIYLIHYNIIYTNNY